MNLTCPCCKSHVPLEAALEDELGRELLAMLAALQPAIALPLVHYLGFFRPAKQQLGWGRALRLARDTVGLGAEPNLLEAALVETNRALDGKRAQPGWKPLGNHNYLRSVLGSLQEQGGQHMAFVSVAATRTPTSKVGQALAGLEDLKR